MNQIRNKKFVVLVAVLCIAIIIFSFSHAFVVRAETVFPEGSQIGGVDVSGKSVEETIQLLVGEIERWKETGQLTIITNQTILEIPYTAIHFDVQQSIQNLEQAIQRPWYKFFSKPEPQSVPLSVQVDRDWLVEQLGDVIDIELATLSIQETVAHLGEQTIDLRNMEMYEPEIVAEITWQAPEDFVFLDSFVKHLHGMEIPDNSMFSFQEKVAKKVSHYSAREGNFFASMLYTLALQSHLTVVERHSQGVIPPYSEPGLEAVIQLNKGKDLVLANTTNVTYIIAAQRDGQAVTLALKAASMPTTFIYKIENVEEIPYRTIVRYDKDLLPDHEQVIQEGKNGKRVTVYKIEQASDGTEISKEFFTRDFYLPIPRIVIKGVPEEQANDSESEGGLIEKELGEFERDGTESRSMTNDDLILDGRLENEEELSDPEDLLLVLELLVELGYLDEEQLPQLLELLDKQTSGDEQESESDDELLYEKPDFVK